MNDMLEPPAGRPFPDENLVAFTLHPDPWVLAVAPDGVYDCPRDCASRFTCVLCNGSRVVRVAGGRLWWWSLGTGGWAPCVYLDAVR